MFSRSATIISYYCTFCRIMSKNVALRNGYSMPIIGIGTFQVRDESVLNETINYGLKVGYRLIDTAACYRNEHMIGNVLKTALTENDLTRDDVFVTSKLHPKYLGAGTREGVLQSLHALQCDVLDLYLIHWPAKSGVKPDDPRNKLWRIDSWNQLIKLRDEGLVRSIGVSNFNGSHIDELIGETGEAPLVNQCEFHPHYTQNDLRSYCQSHGIHFQAYSSFGSPKHKQDLFQDPQVIQLAAELSCSVPQLLLAWPMHQHISVLPRTTSAEHILENWKATEINLEEEQTGRLYNISKRVKYCWDASDIQ